MKHRAVKEWGLDLKLEGVLDALKENSHNSTIWTSPLFFSVFAAQKTNFSARIRGCLGFHPKDLHTTSSSTPHLKLDKAHKSLSSTCLNAWPIWKSFQTTASSFFLSLGTCLPSPDGLFLSLLLSFSPVFGNLHKHLQAESGANKEFEELKSRCSLFPPMFLFVPKSLGISVFTRTILGALQLLFFCGLKWASHYLKLFGSTCCNISIYSQSSVQVQKMFTRVKSLSYIKYYEKLHYEKFFCGSELWLLRHWKFSCPDYALFFSFNIL